MNEKTVIDHLKKARLLEPNLMTQEKIASKIFGTDSAYIPSERKQTQGFFSWLFSKQMGASVALSMGVVMLLIGVVSTNVNIMHQIKIATAPNVYEKAKLSVAYAKRELDTVRVSQNSGKEQQLLAQEITATETTNYINGLNLVGEPGKYTAEECDALYEEYDKYLSQYKNELIAAAKRNPTDKQKFERLHTTLDKLDAAADKRWEK